MQPAPGNVHPILFGKCYTKDGSLGIGGEIPRFWGVRGVYTPRTPQNLALTTANPKEPQRFREMSLGSEQLVPSKTKKLHWHVDHLLDLFDAELVGVVAIRSPIRMEAELGHWLVTDLGTEIIAAGLGANDVPGGTHVLRVVGGETWWDELPGRIKVLLAAKG